MGVRQPKLGRFGCGGGVILNAPLQLLGPGLEEAGPQNYDLKAV